jgi:hypothetical protein
MSSLRARIDEQLQLYSKFLGSNDLVLKSTDLLMRIKEDRSSLELFLQKNSFKGKFVQKPELKIKVEQVEGETLAPQVDL